VEWIILALSLVGLATQYTDSPALHSDLKNSIRPASRAMLDDLCILRHVHRGLTLYCTVQFTTQSVVFRKGVGRDTVTTAQ
jgi:hypothetical protein